MALYNAEIAHLWFHQAPDASGSNFFFKGPILYSYGFHSPLARLVVKPNHPPRLVLIRDSGGSQSTRIHLGLARQAIPGYVRVIEVGFPGAKTVGEHKGNYRRMRSGLLPLGLAVIGARSRKQERFSEYLSLVEDMNHYTKEFKLGFRQVPLPDAEGVGGMYQVEAAKVTRALQRKRAVFARELSGWLAGGAQAIRPPNRFAHLRIKPGEPETVETSMGATVPLAHVVKAWQIIKRCYRSGVGFEPEGKGRSIHLGYYTVDQVEEGGTIHIGCHSITKAEVLRFVETIGLT